jgi:hypothetical protein
MVGSAGNSDLDVGTFGWNIFLAVLGVVMMLVGFILADPQDRGAEVIEQHIHNRRVRERREFQSRTRMDWESGMSYPNTVIDGTKVDKYMEQYIMAEMDKFISNQKVRQKMAGMIAYNAVYGCYMVLVDFINVNDWKFCFCNEDGRPTSPVNRCNINLDDFEWRK